MIIVAQFKFPLIIYFHHFRWVKQENYISKKQNVVLLICIAFWLEWEKTSFNITF